MGPAHNYAELLAQANSTFVTRQERAAEHRDTWLWQEMFARAAFARARLTGSYDDYATAQAALDQGFSTRPPAPARI